MSEPLSDRARGCSPWLLTPLYVPTLGTCNPSEGARRHGPILTEAPDICPQNPHTRPCIHQSQATIPPPSRLHTPRHYSVSAQVSAIPLRRRVVVELWWYEGALAPVDPQHRTGTRRDTGCVQRMVARAGTPSGPGGWVIPRGDICAHADASSPD